MIYNRDDEALATHPLCNSPHDDTASSVMHKDPISLPYVCSIQHLTQMVATKSTVAGRAFVYTQRGGRVGEGGRKIECIS